jgi:hypothetical protein
VRKSSVFVQLEEPIDVIEGDLWLEIDGLGKPSLDGDDSSGDGSGTIGNTVLSDWEENDSTSLAYIKNRTHWVGDNGTVFPLSDKFIPQTIARISDIKDLSTAYVQNEEPPNAAEGSLWVDTDEIIADSNNNIQIDFPKIAAMSNLTQAPTAEDFNALLDLLRAANLMAIQ